MRRRLEKDPDEQVRHAIELVFSKFRELGSARQVSLWFRQEQIPVPKRRSPLADPVDFVPATTWRITGLLKNPAYAGVYAFGRTRRRVVLIEGRKRHVKQRERRPDQWQVLLQDHHEGYITWTEYLTNQERLEQNRSALGEAVSGAARPGKGLLAGTGALRPLRTKDARPIQWSSQRDSVVVYYYCVAAESETVGKQVCRIFGGVTVEQAVVEAVLDAAGASPHGGHVRGRCGTRGAPDGEAAAGRNGAGARPLRSRPMRAAIQPSGAREPAGGPHAGDPLERGDGTGPRPGTAVRRTTPMGRSSSRPKNRSHCGDWRWTCRDCGTIRPRHSISRSGSCGP